MVRADIITYVLVLSKEFMTLHARGRLILINLLINYGKQECLTSCVMKLDKITHITKAINLVLFFLCFTSKVSTFYCSSRRNSELISRSTKFHFQPFQSEATQLSDTSKRSFLKSLHDSVLAVPNSVGDRVHQDNRERYEDINLRAIEKNYLPREKCS